MTYGYIRNYEDRVRRAVNTPDANGNYALWQGGMEPNIPVGSTAGVAASMKKAKAGAVRRDHHFILGATNTNIPNYKTAFLAIMRQFNSKGIIEINGHLMYRISDAAYAEADKWLDKTGLSTEIDTTIKTMLSRSTADINAALDHAATRLLELWQMEASLKTYGVAVADVMAFHIDEGTELPMTIEEWHAFVENSSFVEAREQARSMGFSIIWNCDIARTPEGYYQVRGGIPYAIAKSLAVAPFADIIWMETKTADLPDAKIFADAIHAVYPGKMLAYNLSPSFNWDSTGMSEDKMRHRPQRRRYARPGPLATQAAAYRFTFQDPTEDNQRQAKGMLGLKLYDDIQTEVGQIIVARVNAERVKGLVKTDSDDLKKLIAKG